MAFFRREDETDNPYVAKPGNKPTAEPTAAVSAQTKSRGATTHISAGSRILGEVRGNTDMRVDGVIDGTLVMDSQVVVGPSGLVKGEVRARAVHVAGRVEGNIHGAESIEILAEGRVDGDVCAPRVMIADGAFFKGSVEMQGAD